MCHQALDRSILRDGDAVYRRIHQVLRDSPYQVKQRERVGSGCHRMHEQDGETA